MKREKGTAARPGTDHMNGIEKITGRIAADAAAYAAVTEKETAAGIADLHDARESERAFLMADARTAAERARKEILARADAQASMERRRITAAGKRDAAERAYAAARDAFLAAPDEQRKAWLLSLLEKAVREHIAAREEARRLYGEEEDAAVYRVTLSARDASAIGAALIAEARAALGPAGDKLALADAPGRFEGGLLLSLGDMDINLTLPMLLSRARETGEGAVYRLLFEEGGAS